MDYRSLPEQVKSELAKAEPPFFFFDLDRVSEKIRQVRHYIKPNQIYFAIKCNSLPPILETVASSGCGFEVNNSAELKKAISANATRDQIINSSPKTSATDIREMYGFGVRKFTFDSKEQVDNLAINAPGSKVILRIFSTNEGSRFDLSKSFGIHPSLAPGLLYYAKRYHLDLYGIMFHVGSQCHSLHNWKAGISQSAKLFKQFPDLKFINIGGDLPICYQEPIPSIEEISMVINQAINDNFRKSQLFVSNREDFWWVTPPLPAPLLFISPVNKLFRKQRWTCLSTQG
jgi:ornithine decarboxylase